MRRIAVFSIGGVGSRQVRGAADLKVECRVFAVNPSAASQEFAAERWADAGGARDRLTTHKSVDGVPASDPDLAAATAAPYRLVAFELHLAAATVDNVIFEKVPFQEPDLSDEMVERLKYDDFRALVNSQPRAYDDYARIRKASTDGQIDVSGQGRTGISRRTACVLSTYSGGWRISRPSIVTRQGLWTNSTTAPWTVSWNSTAGFRRGATEATHPRLAASMATQWTSLSRSLRRHNGGSSTREPN